MAKIKCGLLLWCLSTLVALTLVGEGAALTLFDDTLFITGYVKNETAVRLEDRKWMDPERGQVNAELRRGELSRCRTTMQIQADWGLTSDLVLNAIARGYYEAKYSLDDDIPERSDAFNSPAGAGGDIDNWDGSRRGGRNMRQDFELREYKLTYQTGPFTIRAGRQQIVWGESDNLRMADIINPLDMSWNSGFPTWEDIRIPLRMVNLLYTVPNSKHKYQIELALNPEDFKPHSFAPYGDQWWLEGDRPWRLPPFAAAFPTTQSIGSAVEIARDAGQPERHSLRNFQGGIRVRGVFGPWDVYLYDYYQRVQSPVMTSGPIPPIVPGFLDFGPFNVFDSTTFGIEAHYPHINTFGGTFNVYESRTGAVFRGECGYTADMPYTVFRPWNIIIGPAGINRFIGFFDTDYVEKDTFSYMLGFDRPTFIRWLNPTKTFLISGQFFQSYIFDLDDDEGALTLMGKKGSEDHSTTLTFMMNTEYCDAKIKPQVVCVYEQNADSGFVNPKIAFEPNYDWVIELGARFLWGDSYTAGRWGGIKDNDEVWLMVQYKF